VPELSFPPDFGAGGDRKSQEATCGPFFRRARTCNQPLEPDSLVGSGGEFEATDNGVSVSRVFRDPDPDPFGLGLILDPGAR
jgi:hypothetical protein